MMMMMMMMYNVDLTTHIQRPLVSGADCTSILFHHSAVLLSHRHRCQRVTMRLRVDRHVRAYRLHLVLGRILGIGHEQLSDEFGFPVFYNISTCGLKYISNVCLYST